MCSITRLRQALQKTLVGISAPSDAHLVFAWNSWANDDSLSPIFLFLTLRGSHHGGILPSFLFGLVIGGFMCSYICSYLRLPLPQALFFRMFLLCKRTSFMTSLKFFTQSNCQGFFVFFLELVVGDYFHGFFYLRVPPS